MTGDRVGDNPGQASRLVRLGRDGGLPSEGLMLRLGTTRLRGWARYLTWLDAGRTLMSRGYALHLWEAANGREALYWEEPDFGLVVAASPDGTLLASAVPLRRGFYFRQPDLDESGIALWDVASRRRINVLRGHTFPVTALAFSGDGRELASGAQDGTVRLWDVGTGRQRAEFTWRGGLGPDARTDSCHFVAYSPDGRTLASLGIDPAPERGHPSYLAISVKLWDRVSLRCEPILASSAGVPTGVAFSADGSEVFAGGLDGGLWAWRTATGELVRPPRMTGDSINAIASSRDGRWVATGDTEGRIRLWDARDHLPIRTIDAHRLNISALAFDPAGDRLASGGFSDAIKLWDVATGAQLLADDEAHDDMILCVAFAPGGGLLASAGVDRSIRLWDPASGRQLGKLEGHAGFVDCLAFSPDGRSLASSGTDQVAKVWDVASGGLTRTFRGHTDRVDPILFSPDGRLLLTASYDGTIRAWEVATGEQVFRMDSRAVPAGLSPDGSTLAVVGRMDPVSRRWDPSIQLHDLKTGRHLGAYRSGRDMPLSLPSCAADGAAWAEGSRGVIWNIWEEAMPLPRRVVDLTSLRGPSGEKLNASVAAFSRDGKWLAYSIGRTIFLMDRASDRVVREWEGDRWDIRALAFSPSGDRLASAGYDTTVILWDLSRRPYPERVGQANR